jgi:hypothetical protein
MVIEIEDGDRGVGLSFQLHVIFHKTFCFSSEYQKRESIMEVFQWFQVVYYFCHQSKNNKVCTKFNLNGISSQFSVSELY